MRSRPAASSPIGAGLRRVGPRTSVPVPEFHESKIAVAVPAARQQRAGVDVRFPNVSSLAAGNLPGFASHTSASC